MPKRATLNPGVCPPARAIACATFFAAAGCTLQGPSDEDLDLPHPPGIDLEHVYTIDEEQAPGRVTEGTIAVASNGDLAIIDPFGRQVHLHLREEGRHLVLGQHGRGPAEFDGPRNVAFLLDGGVAVFDRAIGRMSTWTRTGEHRADFAVPRITAMRADDHGLLAKILPERSAPLDGSFEVIRIDVQELRTDDVILVEHRWLREEGDAADDEEALPQICSICPFYRTSDGGFVFQRASFDDQVLKADSAGRRQLTWSAGREAAPFPVEDWRDYRRRLRVTELDMLADLFPGTPPTLGPIRESEPGMRRPLDNRGTIGLDGNGRLWTLPAVDRGMAGKFDVFDPHGERLGTVRMEGRPVQIDVNGEWIAAVYEDELDLPRVEVLRIRENEH